MHKRKIMNYHQNEVNRVIAAQILADRAGLDNLQKAKLVERAKKIEIKDSKKNSFIRLANKRVSKAIKSIRLVKNLSNKRSYKLFEWWNSKIRTIFKRSYCEFG